MKEVLVSILAKIKDDANFIIYHYTPEGTFTNSFEEKIYIENLLNDTSNDFITQRFRDVIMISESIGVSIRDLDHNIYHETKDTDGFIEHICKYNKYYKIYIKLDKENKTITFKLGDKIKKLELLEEGFEGYISKPYKQKYLKCVSFDDLERHINDEFWNPRMVDIGRKVLKLKEAI